VYQISAGLEYAYVSSSDFCKVCEMTKKEKMKIFLLEGSYLGLELTPLCYLDKTSQSYGCVKIAALLYLSIY